MFPSIIRWNSAREKQTAVVHYQVLDVCSLRVYMCSYCIYMFSLYICVLGNRAVAHYGVATISRMLKNIGLFCKRALQKRPVFCKETCIFKHPTHRSHPIPGIRHVCVFSSCIYVFSLYICVPVRKVRKRNRRQLLTTRN